MVAVVEVVAQVEAQVKHTVFIAIGSNLLDRKKNIEEAISNLKKEGIEIVAISSIIETEPYGFTDQPKFLNCVVKAKTTKTPRELLKTLLSIELKLGRIREKRWGPRTIDLDILFYDDLIIDEEDLKIPHYDIQNRLFVLKPLSEIAGDFIHPVFKVSINELLNNLIRREDHEDSNLER